MTNPRVKTMTINIGDIDVHVHAGAGLESHRGEEGHHGESAGISDKFCNNLFFKFTINYELIAGDQKYEGPGDYQYHCPDRDCCPKGMKC